MKYCECNNYISKQQMNTLLNCIKSLNEADALELQPSFDTENQLDFYIPYMMNDALEYYFILKNCRLTGEVPESLQFSDTSYHMEAEVISEDNNNALVVRVFSDPDNSVQEFKLFTIWFYDIQIICNCYQYHQIGHFWIKGQEQWRRLVYLIGTIYDKQEYIGDIVCSDQERALLPLMEFAPFRMWFPLHAIPKCAYGDTLRGSQCIQKLALEAGDVSYARMIIFYRHLPCSWMRTLLSPLLSRALASPKRQSLYQLILEKVSAASQIYPERDYESCLNAEIRTKREQVTCILQGKGFTGTYPLFYREFTQILAVEEHPFTVMENEDFSFRIRFMVSEVCPSSQKKKSHHDITDGINYGFFHTKQTKGWIAENLDFL